MSRNKARVREDFRYEVFLRDGDRCRVCGLSADGCDREESKNAFGSLDAHHITPREDMPNGGYVLSNGIALCPHHHRLAEAFLKTGDGTTSPAYLYGLIDSSEALARKHSLEGRRRG